MLVLTRKPMETIKIGNDVVIKVICTGTKSVRIGIEAPESVRILRGELAEYPATEYPATEYPATEYPATEEPMPADLVPPFVADAVVDLEADAMEELVIVGPMTAEKFLAEFSDDWLPGRSIRRMLQSQRPALNAAAK
jgi:carbon storage regulator CsrA